MDRDRDIGMLLGALVQAVIAAEEPALTARGVTMWEYVVLAALDGGAAPTQSHLAATVRRDKTRLIPILDALEVRGLLRRTPDPDDRRNRIVALTTDGRAMLDACRAAVRDREQDLFGRDGARRLRAALARAVDALAEPGVPGG